MTLPKPLRRSEREYLWFGIAIFAPAIAFLAVYVNFGHPLGVQAFDSLELLTRTVSRLAYAAFFLRLLTARPTWFLRFAIVCLLLNVVTLLLVEGTGTLSVTVASLLGTLCGIPSSSGSSTAGAAASPTPASSSSP